MRATCDISFGHFWLWTTRSGSQAGLPFSCHEFEGLDGTCKAAVDFGQLRALAVFRSKRAIMPHCIRRYVLFVGMRCLAQFVVADVVQPGRKLYFPPTIEELMAWSTTFRQGFL